MEQRPQQLAMIYIMIICKLFFFSNNFHVEHIAFTHMARYTVNSFNENQTDIGQYAQPMHLSISTFFCPILKTRISRDGMELLTMHIFFTYYVNLTSSYFFKLFISYLRSKCPGWGLKKDSP